MTGAHVFGAVREVEKTKKVVEEITSTAKGGKITLIEMKLDNLASVHRGAEDFLNHSKQLNVLINNAGYVRSSQVVSA